MAHRFRDVRESRACRSVTIRGQAHSVVQALQRNLNHVVYHTGQIVQLARHFTGDAWQTLSIAPGKSDEHNAAMRSKYGDWWANEQNKETEDNEYEWNQGVIEYIENFLKQILENDISR